jgi:hypothetical protein
MDIRDAKMLIIDEISMVGLEDLAKISKTISSALVTQLDDPEAKDRAVNLPFGGLHVVFVGDLFQLAAGTLKMILLYFIDC